jgi:heme-degrading monooxygenase HmoA
MYGTVARVTASAESRQALMEFSQQDPDDPIPGLISTYVYQMDSDPNEYYLAVVFDSRESYHANAQSPEQNTRYERLRALLPADPEWHDGEIIVSSTG